MTGMQELYLDANKLTGTPPTEWSKMTGMQS